jgi:5-methylcytosine-specific restriction endonuclease McrA
MPPLSWRPRTLRLRHRPEPKVRREPDESRANRKRIAADTRLFVWQRDGGRCCDCGSTSELQFDHIVPVAKGGSNTAQNVELLCADCNRRKAARLFTPEKALLDG